MSVWALLSGRTGKCYLGGFKDCLTATLGCANTLWKYSHLATEVTRGAACLRDAQAGFTRKPPAGVSGSFLSQYLINQLAQGKYGSCFLVFNGKVYPLKEPSVRTPGVTLQAAAAEMTPGQTPCGWEEVQAVMLIPFFIFLMKPPSCHFRGEEALTSCADESLLLTGQQAGIESAVWSSCSVNHSQKAQRKLKGNACE